MTFQKPFYCVDMKEMIELAEMVEVADEDRKLSNAEIFGFACAPVNLGLVEHVQYYMWILNHYVQDQSIYNEPIDDRADNIDYLETSIKCVELFQWLSRHFNGKNFSFDEKQLLENKGKAIERLNELLSDKIGKTCSSCGCKMPANAKFNICEDCFSKRRFQRRGPPRDAGPSNKDGGRDFRRGSGPGKGKRDDRRDERKDKSSPQRSSSQNEGSGKPQDQGIRRPRPAGLKPKGGGKKSDVASAFRKHR
jgi:ATP-dependent RNA helicase SUPV3L1/SUV3